MASPERVSLIRGSQAVEVERERPPPCLSVPTSVRQDWL